MIPYTLFHDLADEVVRVEKLIKRASKAPRLSHKLWPDAMLILVERGKRALKGEDVKASANALDELRKCT